MTTDELIMQEMLDRATNPAKETADELSLQMFCMLVKNNAQLVQKAQEMILTKICGSNVTEATRAIALLEDCMAKCGSEFQDEVAKNRFLNNFIRLVLPKYDGASTPMAIKQRIMECLLLWTTEFPGKTKIRIVYEMLAKEGDVELLSGASVASTATAFNKRESILGNDEDVLKELLSSNDPENYKRANMLIQSRVKQESRRTELLLQRKNKLQEIQETVSLLNEMLGIYASAPEQAADGSCETMQELYAVCKSHKSMLRHLTEMINDADDSLLDETIETNESLRLVLGRYKTMLGKSSSAANAAAAARACQPSQSAVTSNTDLLTDFVMDDLPASMPVPAATVVPQTTPAVKSSNTTTLAELHEIFGAAAVSDKKRSSNDFGELFGSLEILEPISVCGESGKREQTTDDIKEQQSDKRTFRELPVIDQLSEALLKQSLPGNDRRPMFKKEPEKLTLNDLVKKESFEAATISTTTSVPSASAADSSDRCADQQHDDKDDSSDDVLMLQAECVASEEDDRGNIEADTELPPTTKSAVKHLQDITIELDDVVPLAESLLLEDSDVKITMSHTENRPSQEVSVIVLSVVNKSKLPIQDLHMEATVKKPCKVRLVPPTGSTLAPYKPFRPPPLANQVMLLLNPTKQPVDVNCLVGYRLGDDPDPVKELIVARDIPYVQ